ncbi:DNA primase TraC [Thalassocella blandensis]|nr:DNA primase TraC [Thalassocella blandensis]
MTDFEPLSDDEVRDLLSLPCFDPDKFSQPEWAKIAGALKNEFGQLGLDIFDDWSRTGSDYDLKAVRSVFKSVKAFGGNGTYTIASLVYEAKQYGWQRKKRDLSHEDKKRLACEQAERRAAREKAEREERVHLAKWYDVVAACANELMDKFLVLEGKSFYLEQKKVRGFNVRFVRQSVVAVFYEDEYRYELITGYENIKEFWVRRDGEACCQFQKGATVVPAFNAAGQLRNLQVIFAAKKKPGDKRFLPATTTGLFHELGSSNSGPVMVGEGYATVASAYMAMACEWAAFTAFNSGKLLQVCEVVRERFPDRPILVLADDDHITEAEKGHNPGIDAAKLCAEQIPNCFFVPPKFQERANG